MTKLATPRGGAFLSALVAAAILSGLLILQAAHASPSLRVVQTAKSSALGKSVLVNRRGLTLYSLSVEQRGRFICANSQCLSFWTPLVVAKGVKPTGAPKLGTVRRPDGRIQVTYRGRPLYRFKLDRKRGDAKGEGFKDVGTWHAASPSAKTMASMPPSNPYPGGY
jgi:predicted lipoprotein with Yx(FWY)xxD motif